MSKISSTDAQQFKPIARIFTAWIIDVGRAIVQGGADNRIAALEQSESVVDSIVGFINQQETEEA